MKTIEVVESNVFIDQDIKLRDHIEIELIGDIEDGFRVYDVDVNHDQMGAITKEIQKYLEVALTELFDSKIKDSKIKEWEKSETTDLDLANNDKEYESELLYMIDEYLNSVEDDIVAIEDKANAMLEEESTEYARDFLANLIEDIDNIEDLDDLLSTEFKEIGDDLYSVSFDIYIDHNNGHSNYCFYRFLGVEFWGNSYNSFGRHAVHVATVDISFKLVDQK